MHQAVTDAVCFYFQSMRRKWSLAVVFLIVLWFRWKPSALRWVLQLLGWAQSPKRITGPSEQGVQSDKKKKPVASALDAVRRIGNLPVSDEELQRILPRRYELHDHIAVIKLNQGVTLEEFIPLAELFAQGLRSIGKYIDVVIADTEGITGELRKPVHVIAYRASTISGAHQQLLHKVITKRYKGTTYLGDAIEEDEVHTLLALAESPSFTLHVEKGVKYCFDVMKVMFCSGNTTERMHFSELDAKDERVVDMFAGIGYFTLPLAMRGGVKEIISLEKNPDSCWFLRINALINGVGNRVTIHQGDNRLVTGSQYEGRCDRVIMGYIPTCEVFLPRAYSFLKPADNIHDRRVGIIHYHFLAGERKEAYTTVYKHVITQLGEDVAGTFEVETLRQVKSYSPKTWHYVADITFH